MGRRSVLLDKKRPAADRRRLTGVAGHGPGMGARAGFAKRKCVADGQCAAGMPAAVARARHYLPQHGHTRIKGLSPFTGPVMFNLAKIQGLPDRPKGVTATPFSDHPRPAALSEALRPDLQRAFPHWIGTETPKPGPDNSGLRRPDRALPWQPLWVAVRQDDRGSRRLRTARERVASPFSHGVKQGSFRRNAVWRDVCSLTRPIPKRLGSSY
jgi:hypothetical protein